MVVLSQGWALAPFEYLLSNQLQAAAANVYNHEPPARLCPIGRGVPFAFGRADGFHQDVGISPERAQFAPQLLDSPQGLLHLLVGFEESLNASGLVQFDRHAAEAVEVLERSRESGKQYSKAIRKRAYVASLVRDFYSLIEEALKAYGLTMDGFLALPKERLMEFFQSVPCLDVEIELATEKNEFRDRPIERNDLTDMGFLRVAIPHCDLVVTEKFWVDLTKRKHLDTKYDTEVMYSLAALVTKL
jgi:hypothetical protein